MKRELVIEWRHYDKEGATCDRCAATGASIRGVIAELGEELGTRGVCVTLRETPLPEEKMAQSNMILFDGIALEELLDDATADENSCPSCSCLTGTDTNCRIVKHQGKSYEEIPGELIRKAAYKALERE